MTPAADRARRSAVWTRYWRSGALHSCGTSWDGNYGGAIGRHWRTVAASLGPGARVLDIATGNGPVPRLLAECAADRAPGIDAIDLADIAPDWVPAWNAGHPAAPVRFHGRTSAEALPFADGRFDLVTSQFGLEYGDVERALSELVRVLRAGGRFSAIVHHRESVIARVSTEELRHIDWLCAPAGLLDAAQAMVAPMARAATPEGRAALNRDAAAIAARDRFNALQGETDARIAGSAVPDVLHEARDAIARVLQAAMTHARADTAAAQLAAYRGALDDGALRLRELIECAWDAHRCEAHLNGLRAAGLEVAAVPLDDEGRLLGWSVGGRKKGEA